MFTGWFKRKRSANDFAEEIQSHLELEADELTRAGATRQQAEREARVAFGNVAATKENFSLRSRFAWLDKFLRDVRFGMRSLRNSPGFTITAVITLALGIGANTAVFSVMNAVLLRSLPVRDPQNVVYIKTTGAPRRSNQTGDAWETSFSYPVYQALRQNKNVLSDVIAYIPLSTDKIALRMGTQPEQGEGDMVSGNFFSGLGVDIIRGRGFTPQDEQDHNNVAVLSYNYWTEQLAHDPNVLGRTIFIKGLPFTIVGIAGKGFEGVEPGHSTDLWIPLQDSKILTPWGNPPTSDNKTLMNMPNWWCIKMLARLAPGVTSQQAAAQLQSTFYAATYISLGKPMADEKPPTISFAEAKNFPGYEEQWGKPLYVLMAMVGLVLIIALTNVVMLLMARNSTRQKEFSLRLALGAKRGELLRQLLTESFLLVTLSGSLAWGFAILATRMLGRWAQINSSLAPDRTVLLFTLAVLAFAAVLFGLAPFRTAIAGGAELTLKTSAATSNTDTGKTRSGKIIVSLQMALCVVLLVSAALLIRTLQNLENIPLGIKTQGLLVFGIDPQSTHTNAAEFAFYDDLLRKLRNLPGVEDATLMANRLGSGWSSNNNAVIDGRKMEDAGTPSMERSNYVGTDYFRTLGTSLVAGRDFSDADTSTSQQVAIVSELFAQRFLPNQNPLGHRINGFSGSNDVMIIGVAKNSKYTSMTEDPVPMVWYYYMQAPVGDNSHFEMHVEMRVKGDTLAMLPTVRKVVAQMDPDAPLIQPMTQRAQFEQSITHQLLFAHLAEVFGLLAVLLVATGLYGTLAYRVNKRTAEIGVRMAVGARRGQVVWMVLRDSLTLTIIGVAIGIPLAISTGQWLVSSLYGVKPLDITSYLIAVAGVLIVGLTASAIPAGRAASVDPLTALRCE